MPKNDVSIKISADSKSAEAALKKLESGLGDAEKSAKGFFASMDKGSAITGAFSVAVGALAAQAVTKAIGALKNFGAEILQEADHVRKMSEVLGMSVEDTAGFEKAVKQAGGSAEGFGQAMQGMAKALDPSQVSENRKALEQLGVSVKDSNGLFVSQKELLLRVADAYNKETDATKKANLGAAAFGKSAKEMTVFLNQGREAIEEQVSLYGKASGYSEEYAKSLEKLNSSLADAETCAKGALVALTDTDMFRSAIQWVSDLSSEWVKFLAELKTKKATEEIASLNDKMGDYADKVAEIELRKAKGENKGYFKKDLDDLREGLPAMEAAASRINGIAAALEKAKSAGENANTIRKLNEELEGAKQVYSWTKQQKDLDAEAAAAEAKAAEARKKAEQQAAEGAEKRAKAAEAAKKAFESEEESLARWLEAYKKSKMTEVEIAEASYKEQAAKFENLLNRQKISIDEYREYMAGSEADLNLKLSQIRESAHAEAMARSKAEWDAKVAQWEEEKRIIDEKKAKETELQEHSWQLRETVASTEEERLAIQLERINARYDAEIEKARETGELLAEIEQAHAAEVEAAERRIQAARAETASQYANSMTTIAKSMATLGKAGGDKMKAIAIAEAIINSSLAFTKALASAPPPLNGILASAALASGMAQVAVIQRQKFAEGGIVGGNSYYGDKVPVSVNSGEMIFNKEQQKRLLAMANGNGAGTGNQTIVNFSPNIAPSLNAEDVKKMIKENSAVFETFFARAVATGAGKTGVFV